MPLNTINNRTVAAAGTPVALSATTILCNWVLIQALAGNGGKIYVGDATVLNTGLGGITLEAPFLNSNLPFQTMETSSLTALFDLNLIFIDADSSTDGVNVVYAQIVSSTPSTGLSTKTVQDLLDTIILMTQEDSTFSSGFWSETEVIDYINIVERNFFQLTGSVKAQTDITGTAGERLFNEPTDSMELDRITFNDIPLFRTNRWQLDAGNRDWKNLTGKPRQFHQDLLATKQFEFDREIVTAGTIGTTYTKLPVVRTATTDILNVPDAFCHYVLYGVLYRMLNKQGEGQDLARAQYCQMRYRAGIQIVKAMMLARGDQASSLFNAA